MADRRKRRAFVEAQAAMSSLTATRPAGAYGRRSAQDEAEARWLGSRPGRPMLGQAGVSGTPYSGEANPYEENPELRGRLWPLTVRQMLLDPAVAVVWSAIKQTLLSSSWRWESADEEDPLANRLRDWMAESWGGMAVPWEKQLGAILEAFPVGFRYVEEEYELRDDEDGARRWHLRQYHDREPAAHQQWVRDPDTGDLLMVTQAATYGRRAPEPIPASKLLLISHNITGQNYAGRGLFRAMWFYWRLKTLAGTSAGVGMERWAVPPMVVKVDRIAGEDAGYDDAAIDALRDAAVSEANRFLAADQAYMVASNAVTFEPFSPTYPASNAAGSVIEVIRECDTQIFTAGLVQFLRLGVTDSGSRGVSETMETFFRRAAVNMLDEVADAINGGPRPGGGTVGRLVGWNFGAVPASKLPRLVHDGLKVDPLADHLPALQSLMAAGAVVKSRALTDKLHDVLGVPEPTDEEREAAEESAAIAANPLMAMAERRRKGDR